MSKSIGPKIRHIIQALISALLFFFQYMPVSGPWYGFMVLPLAAYVSVFFWGYSEFRGSEIYLLFFSPRLMFGRVVAIIGFVVFLAACFQFLRGHGRLITSGLYSVVRHPQYFGIIVMTLGISVMSMQYTMGASPEVMYAWLFQVCGYVLLAGYEERHLLIEYGKEYQQYRHKVSFIFPALNSSSEPLLSLIIALIIAFFLLTFI